MDDEEALLYIQQRYPDQPMVWAAYLKARRVMKGTNALYQAAKAKANMKYN